MTASYFSDEHSPCSWSENIAARETFGPKAAGLMVVPRSWTPPFIAVPCFEAHSLSNSLPKTLIEKIESLANPDQRIIVRSSIIGETIWDRGRYKSVVVSLEGSEWIDEFQSACRDVIGSASGKSCAILLQRFLDPWQRGEFGNLLRISKTRDQWELTTQEHGRATSYRFNTQRDEAAIPALPLAARPRLSRERLFGSVAAWLNNELLHGQSVRLNLEWIADRTNFYLVQIDEEGPDDLGINPIQIAISPIHKSTGGSGKFVQYAEQEAIKRWDKLKVLEELWTPDDTRRPRLFYIPLNELPTTDDAPSNTIFIHEFERLLGPDNIVVRTSARRDKERPLNLPRTDCLTPSQAAHWCLVQRDKFTAEAKTLANYAFVAHRYMHARAAGWARAAPGDAVVEINALWGLPDGLQFCPYDIWDVHIPTETATLYTEYKSNILRCQSDGSWVHLRVKNEIARSQCIARKEALDIARRTRAISDRLGKPCHVMWFVGCRSDDGASFNVPWYWTEAHESAPNHDRARRHSVSISNRETLTTLVASKIDKSQTMIVLRPDHQDLFRDNGFLREVAAEALAHGMPIDLEGSTLAHAYYELIRLGCVVIASSEKDHSRIRKAVPFGKIVRDKIPTRIAARQELEVTKTVPRSATVAFLVGKILEEALEIREGSSIDERTLELADVLEIVRALASLDGISLETVIEAADAKRNKLGGFDEGKVLLQTGIGGSGQTVLSADSASAQVLSRAVGPDSVELPFSFFGFAELGQSRTVSFPDYGMSLEVTLYNDRINLTLKQNPQQLDLPLDLEVESQADSKPISTDE